jgi:hypothetical protein
MVTPRKVEYIKFCTACQRRLKDEEKVLCVLCRAARFDDPARFRTFKRKWLGEVVLPDVVEIRCRLRRLAAHHSPEEVEDFFSRSSLAVTARQVDVLVSGVEPVPMLD